MVGAMSGNVSAAEFARDVLPVLRANCLDCHDAQNRDRLHLASGEPVAFTASYLLCGQCHGDKLRDWRIGIHGKRTGSWNGPKKYLLCVHCHNPHSPHFAPLKPMPPPTRPEDIQLTKGGAR